MMANARVSVAGCAAAAGAGAAGGLAPGAGGGPPPGAGSLAPGAGAGAPPGEGGWAPAMAHDSSSPAMGAAILMRSSVFRLVRGGRHAAASKREREPGDAGPSGRRLPLRAGNGVRPARAARDRIYRTKFGRLGARRRSVAPRPAVDTALNGTGRMR